MDGELTETGKARLLTGRFQQIEPLDYNKTFALVTKFTALCMFLSLMAQPDFEFHQWKWRVFF